MSRYLGIVLSPGACQSEGIETVLDRIAATGASAICTSTSLIAPAPQGVGQREPPLDIDGYDRLLDRPLWGQRELWLQSYPTVPMDATLFEGPYRPVERTLPPELDGQFLHRLLAAAHDRGLAAYVQVSPTVVPGLKAEDQPIYVDGTLPDPARRVARQGCLNNPAVRTYMRALVRATARAYPEADGLYCDWVEYTTYLLQDHFACFCPHCRELALSWGYDWAAMVRDVRALWDKLHCLTARDLEQINRALAQPSQLLEWLVAHPGWSTLLTLKAQSVVRAYRDIRAALDAEGAQQMTLGANGWCAPFNLSSGMDYAALAEVCDALRPKLFTFHWSVLPRWYGRTLLDWNPALPERQVLDTLVRALELPDAISERSLAHYHIPAPDEPHPALPQAWRDKTDRAAAAVAGRAKCYAYAHSYRPLAQWKRTIAVLRDAQVDGLWVQRYGYLSDAKLDALRELWTQQ